MKTRRLKWRLIFLQVLARFQKIARMVLRGVWLTGAGYLLGWSAHVLWGWLPDPRSWWLLGGVWAVVGLLASLLPWPSLSRFTWRLDRKLELEEQLSAALQVARSGSPGRVADLLLEESLQRLPRIRNRVALRGWVLMPDLVAALLVAILFAVILTGAVAPLPEVPETEVERLPPLGEDPRAAEVLPATIPGLEPGSTPEPDAQDGEGTESESDRGETEGQPGASEVPKWMEDFLNSVPPEALEAAFQELGDLLSQEAVTYELGQALMEGDFDSAARALEELASDLESIPPEVQHRMQWTMKGTSTRLEEITGSNPLSSDLRMAAQALEEQRMQMAQSNLDEVARDLRALGEGMSMQMEAAVPEGEGGPSGPEGGPGAGSSISERRSGAPESLERLVGGDEVLELEGASEEEGLLQAGPPDQGGVRPPSRGSYDFVNQGDGTLISSVMTPYHYSWRWRGVVSEYFSR